MSATADDVAATTAATLTPDGASESQQGAESAPAVIDPNEESRQVVEPVQQRINELTRRRYDAERRADDIARDRDEWRERAMRAERPAPVESAPVAAAKTLADFGYDEAKFQAHLIQQAEDRAAKAAESVLTKRQAEETRIRHATLHRGREAEFAKKVPDYFEVAHYAPISNELAALVMESDVSAELAYHLGKNPEVAVKLSQLSERDQAREVGRLEAKLLEKPKAPQVSTAPPPAPKIAAANSQVEKDPKDWTDNDFAKWRKKHMT